MTLLVFASLKYATEHLLTIKGLKIYGDCEEKISIFSFLLEGIHQYDTGMILDKMGIAVRTGTHCAQPVMDFYGIEGTHVFTIQPTISTNLLKELKR